MLVAVTLVVSFLVVVQASIDPTNDTKTRYLCSQDFLEVYSTATFRVSIGYIVALPENNTRVDLAPATASAGVS